jgi:PAS domain-containing protein
VVAGTESAHAILATLTDGRTRHLDAAPWLGPAGEKSWFRRTIVAVGGAAAVVATDVTALREADENLALYSKLVEAAPIGLSVWRLEAPDDPGSFVLEVVNAEAAKMAGVPAGELVGRRMDALTPETVRGGRAAEYVAVTLGELAPFTRRSLVVTPSNRQTEIVVSAFPVPGQRLGLSTLALPS